MHSRKCSSNWRKPLTRSETIIIITPQFFTEREKTLVEHGVLTAAVFRFDSGVCGLRLSNELGHLVMLPFQGQQIWSAEFGGRNLTMKSMFTDPRPTREYLGTYGGFLIHCGATAMGVPSKDDVHPLHGELPNAPYQNACIVIGQDENGTFIGLGGCYQHTVAFSHNYTAEPLVKLYAGSSLFRLMLTVTNLKQSEMELMYLAHINFRPVDGGRLVYSALCNSEHVRVRTSIPSHIRAQPGYAEFIEKLVHRPENHNLLSPDLIFDPEIVFFIDYLTDDAGWAHSMQVRPDGSADYVRHRPEQLGQGIRWISRTADQDALGLVLPATAEPEGYLAEKAKGNIKTVPARSEFRCEIEMGVLSADEAKHMEEKIVQIVVG
ncbi:MAG: DUF4432 family protein [Chloroflexi bacterium]|nr:DUF4432 family protein [Chloroflexota bacterium]